MDFFRKDIISSNTMSGLIDCHSHILPFVDDGVKSLEDSLETLSYMEWLGVSKVILTPHVMGDYPLNQTAFLNERFNSLKLAYKGDIELSLGAEYMLDDQFEELLDRDDLLPIFDSHILIETLCLSAPLNFRNLLHKIQSKGYHIVLAHPERYLYMDNSDYDWLKNKGIKFQLNILSVVGVYGKEVRKRAKRLLDDDYYELLGSDLHNLKSFRREIQHNKLPRGVINKIKSMARGNFI